MKRQWTIFLCLTSSTNVRRKGLLLHLIDLNDTHTVWILWTRDQSVAETSIWQYVTLNKSQTSIHASGGIPHSRLDRATTGVDYRTLYKSEICFRVLVCLLYQCIQNLQLLHIQWKEGQKFASYRKLDAVSNITKWNWDLPNILILRKHGWKR
jgi:hypothetical protein